MVEINTQSDREQTLVEKFYLIKKQKAKMAVELKDVSAELDNIEAELMELLDDQGKKSSARFKGLGHVTCLEPDPKATVVKGQEDILFEYLRSVDRSDMIKTSVHPSSLSTFVKSLLKDGKALPSGINYYMKRALRFFPDKS